MEVERLDRLLLPFVRASDEAESDQLLSSLITEHAEPIITKIVRYKTRATWNGDTHTDAEATKSHLARGVIYAEAGLIDEARAGFQALERIKI